MGRTDTDRDALEEARQEAKTRKLTNGAFHEIDLTTLEGLDVPLAASM